MIKLLHVEDDEAIREIVELSLEMAGGFEVVQRKCGEDALSHANDFTPDVLLLDMMMPGMTGRVSDLLCMSNLAHASKMKEHDNNDDFQRITGRAA